MADETRYHIGRGEETFGPYTPDELRQYRGDGLLLDSDFVWLEDSKQWIGLSEFLIMDTASVAESAEADLKVESVDSGSQAVSAVMSTGNPYPCSMHPDKFSIGHCRACSKLLCAECVCIKSESYYCSTCAKSLSKPADNVVQDFIQTRLAVFHRNPVYGAAVMLVFAVILMPATRTGGAGAVDGIVSEQSNALWKQSQRALDVARILGDREMTERSAKWYDLALSRAEALVDAADISPMIREQSLMYEMRIALDLERYQLLSDLLSTFREKISSPLRIGDLNFFTACDAYLNRKNTAEAISLLEGLVPDEFGIGGGGAQDLNMMVTVMSKPAMVRDNSMQLMDESYHPAEVWYRLGLCYELSKEPKKAKVAWMRAYKSDDKNTDSKKWRRLARSRLEQ